MTGKAKIRSLVWTTAVGFSCLLSACGGEGSNPSGTPVAVAVASASTPTPSSISTPAPGTSGATGTITGGPGNDVLDGTVGDDVMFGGGGDDTLSGLGGNDRLNGEFGNDTLRGGEGDDRLQGVQFATSGVDVLFGDAGADTFNFSAHASTYIRGYQPAISATLADFQTGLDKLELHLTATSGNDYGLYWLESRPFTGQNRLEARFFDGVLQIDDDGDRIPELLIRVAGPIAASDIVYDFDPFGY